MGKGRILVTGASGFLGWNLLQARWPEWEWIGCSQSQDPGLADLALVHCDLTAPGAAERLIEQTQPDVVIHTAAQTWLDSCEIDPAATHPINAAVPAELARHCQTKGIKLVFTSSDMVFDGLRPPYTEEDKRQPINIYGRQKAEAEDRVLQLAPSAAICRMPLMFGSPGPCARNFLPDWLAALKAGRRVSAFVDEIRTPASAATAVAGLRLAVERDVVGLLHLGGRESLSRHAFAQQLCEVWGMNQDGLQPVHQADLDFKAPRPADTSMDSSRAFALGFDPPPLRAQLEALHAAQQETAPIT
ncbi:MAG: NAD(P)-dependent oxidoreductase [Lentisphaerae bacterium]|nr:NAD(P)-dependent oxidoreductase [Lentisphaerota bacterium]